MRAETEAAIHAVSLAIDIADRRVGADEVTSKGGIDLVTATDVAGEDIIRKTLSESFPDHIIVGEERGGEPEAGKPYWLVDPICGTRPFASDVPLYCTNVALVEDNRVTAAAVALGRCGEILHAERGKGAWVRKNGADVRVSPAAHSNTLWVGGRGNLIADIARATMLDRRWFVWQFSSSIAYPYLAAGRIAGLIHIAPHLSSVHTAAGCFLAEEAGARVYDFEKDRDWDLDTRSYLLSATPELHETLLGIVRGCRGDG
ncbi:MAG: inositol monophosphatase [Gammaproteobacteria bacterium]|nr:MAG: inositol monophosphatase [Gammaproteobacteria bacterium]